MPLSDPRPPLNAVQLSLCGPHAECPPSVLTLNGARVLASLCAPRFCRATYKPTK